jgi:hypothetical protein
MENPDTPKDTGFLRIDGPWRYESDPDSSEERAAIHHHMPSETSNSPALSTDAPDRRVERHGVSARTRRRKPAR